MTLGPIYQNKSFNFIQNTETSIQISIATTIWDNHEYYKCHHKALVILLVLKFEIVGTGKGTKFDAFWEKNSVCLLFVSHCEISNISDNVDTIFCFVFCHLQESSGSKGKAGKSKKGK